jgi:hypothetical protein
VNEGAYVEGSVAAGGARSGALSRIDVLLEEGRPECEGGWYAREGGLNLLSVGKSGSLVPSKRTFIWRFRGPDGPTDWVRGPLTDFGRTSDCSPVDTWLLTAAGGSSTRGPTVAAVERSERETNGLVGLVSAALAKRCRAASKASLALARAADRGAGRVGDVLSEPGSRRMVSLCVGVESSS